MCKIVGREYCTFSDATCIGLEDIARKREGGLEITPPPVGRGLRIVLHVPDERAGKPCYGGLHTLDLDLHLDGCRQPSE